MTSRLSLAAGVAAGAALLAAAAAAQAQAAAQAPRPAAAPANQTLTNPGPAIAGVCILDNQRVITQSAVGRAVATRLQQLQQEVNTELTPQRTAIQTEGRTLDQQKATLQQAQLQQRAQALSTRVRNFEQLAAQRGQELEATEMAQLRRIANEMQPVVNTVYGQRGCGILFDRQAVVVANPAMDLTQAVTDGLNRRIQTLTFNRERLNPPAAQQQQR